MVDLVRVVRPRTRGEIEEEAWRARASVGLMPFDGVDVLRLLEVALPKMIPGYELRVEENKKLGKAEAVTDSQRPIITLGERMYHGLERGRPRDRMTGIHEIGHLLMHTGRFQFAFTEKYDPLIDPEKQADIFAESFAMPECAFRRARSLEHAKRLFGVSLNAATYRAKTLRMWGLRHDHGIARRKKGRSLHRAP